MTTVKRLALLRRLARALSILPILSAGCVATKQSPQNDNATTTQTPVQAYVWEIGRICDGKVPPWRMERVEADGRYVIQSPRIQGGDAYSNCMKEEFAKMPYGQWISQRRDGPRGLASTPRPSLQDAQMYDTDSAPRGSRPSAEAAHLERAARSALGVRGVALVADARLDMLAAWANCQPFMDEPPSQAEMARAMQRLGLTDTLAAFVCIGGENNRTFEENLRRALGPIPVNVSLTHIGVASRAVPGGFTGGVAISSRELRIVPFPRVVAPGSRLELLGDVGTRFEKTRLAVTLPSGHGTTQDSGRRFAFQLELPTAGVYGVEILGDGSTGPVILLNVKVYAGVAEPTRADEPPMLSRSTARPEERLLELTNAARARLGIAPLEADAELARLALGHARDMSEHNFFAHVSPRTGSLTARAHAAGIDVATLGENNALSTSADDAHEELMESPAHRAAILDREFTHVGIGTVTVTSSTGEPRFYATEVFARRFMPIDMDEAPTTLLDRVNAERRAEAKPVLKRDATLDAVARAGLDAGARQNGADARTAAALAAARESFTRSVRGDFKGCVLAVHARELKAVSTKPWRSWPATAEVGIAVGPVPGSKEVLIVIAGKGRDALRCS